MRRPVTKAGKLELRLVSAYDAARAEREAASYGGEGLECAVYRNACLLAKALYRDGERMFPDGMAAAKALPAETIACWMRAYSDLCRAEDCSFAGWEQRKQAMAADEKGRLRWKVLRYFGVLPSQARAMTDGDFLYCVLQMVIDGEEQLAKLCPGCRQSLLEEKCPACGAVQFGQNPNFDEKRFEELKSHGSSDKAALDAGIS